MKWPRSCVTPSLAGKDETDSQSRLKPLPRNGVLRSSRSCSKTSTSPSISSSRCQVLPLRRESVRARLLPRGESIRLFLLDLISDCVNRAEVDAAKLMRQGEQMMIVHKLPLMLFSRLSRRRTSSSLSNTLTFTLTMGLDLGIARCHANPTARGSSEHGPHVRRQGRVW